MLGIDFYAETLVREWTKLYKRAPRATLLITLLGALTAGTIVFIAESRSSEAREARRLQNMSYTKQAEALDETRRNLQALVEFVDEERKRLQVSQQSLDSLKAEHDRLRPLVETDRKAIDAVFAAQEARNQAALGTERWIGFGFGVVSSLVASFLWAVCTYALRRRKGETAA